jgi:trafficking protein particle complex subunit 3
MIPCSSRDTSEVIAKVAFKMFLGINAEVAGWNAENTVFSLIFFDNPFVDFVELPPQYSELQV